MHVSIQAAPVLTFSAIIFTEAQALQKKYYCGAKSNRLEKDCVKRRVRGAFGFRSITLAIVMIFVLTLGCLGRVAYIMLAKGEEYRVFAANNQLRDTVISGVRGTVYDRNMNVLVTSTSSWNLCVNSYKLGLALKKYPEIRQACLDGISEKLSAITGADKEKINESLQRSSDPAVRL